MQTNCQNTIFAYLYFINFPINLIVHLENIYPGKIEELQTLTNEINKTQLKVHEVYVLWKDLQKQKFQYTVVFFLASFIHLTQLFLSDKKVVAVTHNSWLLKWLIAISLFHSMFNDIKLVSFLANINKWKLISFQFCFPYTSTKEKHTIYSYSTNKFKGERRLSFYISYVSNLSFFLHSVAFQNKCTVLRK